MGQTASYPCAKPIIERIQASPHGAIPFDEYMDICLYDPQHGYYIGESVRVGKEGDFYTSSNLGSLMGEMIVNDLFLNRKSWFTPADTLVFVEWGGGLGRLAQHMLDHMQEHHPSMYDTVRYICIESSAAHRQQQQQQLKQHAAKVQWLTADEWFGQMDELAMNVVVSNELLDAFPVKRAVYSASGWHEIYVGWDEIQQRFIEMRFPVEKGSRLDHYLKSKSIQWQPGQIVEVNLQAMDWMKQIGDRLSNRGCVVTIDYGDAEERLYAPERVQGTLMCYYRHQAHDDPYIHPGEQDMTAHVNFSDMIRCGEQAGLTGSELMTQKEYLLKAGILNELQDHTSVDPFHPAARRNRFIRQLLLSDGMGDTFKVLVQWPESLCNR